MTVGTMKNLLICSLFMHFLILPVLAQAEEFPSFIKLKGYESLYYNEENSVQYFENGKLELSDLPAENKIMFAVSVACESNVVLKNIFITGDLIVNSFAKDCGAKVYLENISARNIIVMAEASAPIQVEYVGDIKAEGRILEIIGYNKGRTVIKDRALFSASKDKEAIKGLHLLIDRYDRYSEIFTEYR